MHPDQIHVLRLYVKSLEERSSRPLAARYTVQVAVCCMLFVGCNHGTQMLVTHDPLFTRTLNLWRHFSFFLLSRTNGTTCGWSVLLNMFSLCWIMFSVYEPCQNSTAFSFVQKLQLKVFCLLLDKSHFTTLHSCSRQ